MKLVWLLVVLITPIKLAAAQDILPELVRRIKPSAVAIETFDSRGEKLSRGSGFFIETDRIVTNRHVVQGACVATPTGTWAPSTAWSNDRLTVVSRSRPRSAAGLVRAVRGPVLLKMFERMSEKDPKSLLQELVQARFKRVPQYRLCFNRRLADVNVAPQDDGAWLSAVSGTSLAIEIGLRAGLLARKTRARDPTLR